MTLRTRLIGILAISITAGLGVAGVATYASLRSFLYERVDSQLTQIQPTALRALELSARFGEGFPEPSSGGPAGLPIAAYAEVRSAAGAVVASEAFGTYRPDLAGALPEASSGEPFTAHAVEDASYAFRVLSAPLVGGGTLIVAIPLEDAHDTLRRLVAIEIVVAIVLVGAIAFAASLTIRRELQPLDEMAAAATDIAAGDLSRRVDEPDARTEVGRLGRALNRMLEHIEQAFDARRASEERMRRFLGDASHELRTPLTSIRGYAELFRRGASDRPGDLRLSMRRIEEEAARMGVLVDDLLLLAHADRTRPPEVGPVDLAAILEDAARDARARDRDRRIEVDVRDEVVVAGDEDRLRQAVNNLAGNALVHTPPGTGVTLRLFADAGTAVVCVEDSGPGLDPDTLEHAFDRFWRGDPSRSRETGGAGLGLAIVEAVAIGHGGSVEAENRPEGGARFVLRLPLSGNTRHREDVQPS